LKIINTDIFKNSDQCPYFYSGAYDSFLAKEEAKKLVIISDENNNTIACKLWKNKFLNFLQPVYPPLNIDSIRLPENEEQIFLNNLIAFIKERKIADRITQPENFAIFKATPVHATKAKFGTYFIDIEKYSEEDLFKNLHTKHRNVIKNAEKNNVVIKYGQACIEDFYMLYKQTMLRSDMYCQDISYFKEFFLSFPENMMCGVAYHNNIPQGGLFIPYTKFAAFYLYGASAEKTEINGAINYLHWNTIKLLKQKRVKRYDFVGARLSDVSGTRLEGIQQFKKRFGSELEQGYLWKQDINKTKCTLYDKLLGIKIAAKGSKMPLDIIDQENNKYQNAY